MIKQSFYSDDFVLEIIKKAIVGENKMKEETKGLLDIKEKKTRKPRTNIDNLKPLVLSVDNVLDKTPREIAQKVFETYLTSLNIAVTFILDHTAKSIDFSYNLKAEKERHLTSRFNRAVSNKQNPVLFLSSFSFLPRLYVSSICLKFSPVIDYSNFMITAFSGNEFEKHIDYVKIAAMKKFSFNTEDEKKNFLHISETHLTDILEDRLKSSKISSSFFNHYSKVFENSEIRASDLFALTYGLMIADLLGVQPNISPLKNKTILNAQINRIKRHISKPSKSRRILKKDLKEIILEDVDFGVF